MKIIRSKHRRNYTVLPNAALRHAGLSLVAVGLLGRLLSLEDGTRETVDSIAEQVAESRQSVSRAMNELEARGYVARIKVQGPGGKWSTAVVVRDVPENRRSSPTNEIPTVGEPAVGSSAANPKGFKNQEKVTQPQPLPEDAEASTAEADQDRAEGAGSGEAAQEDNPETARALNALAGLGHVDRRLRVSTAEAVTLAPLVAEWFARGVSDAELRAELTDGLPDQIIRPARLIASRLDRKMPMRPAVRAEAPRRVECQECRAPKPANGEALCRDCAPVRVDVAEAEPLAEDARGALDRLREAFRKQVAAGTARSAALTPDRRAAIRTTL